MYDRIVMINEKNELFKLNEPSKLKFNDSKAVSSSP